MLFPRKNALDKIKRGKNLLQNGFFDFSVGPTVPEIRIFFGKIGSVAKAKYGYLTLSTHFTLLKVCLIKHIDFK